MVHLEIPRFSVRICPSTDKGRPKSGFPIEIEPTHMAEAKAARMFPAKPAAASRDGPKKESLLFIKKSPNAPRSSPSSTPTPTSAPSFNSSSSSSQQASSLLTTPASAAAPVTMRTDLGGDVDGFVALASAQTNDLLRARIVFVAAKTAEGAKPPKVNNPTFPMIKMKGPSAAKPVAPTSNSTSCATPMTDASDASSSTSSSASSSSSTTPSSTAVLGLVPNVSVFGKDYPYPAQVLAMSSSISAAFLHWPTAMQATFRLNPPGPGFHNLGNTCFMNSALQVLLHTPLLAQWLCLGSGKYQYAALQQQMQLKQQQLQQQMNRNKGMQPSSNSSVAAAAEFPGGQDPLRSASIDAKLVFAQDKHRKRCALTQNGKFCSLCVYV